MKSNSLKYEEAIARNISNLYGKRYEYYKKVVAYTSEEKRLSVIKHKLGIRQEDKRFDKVLNEFSAS